MAAAPHTRRIHRTLQGAETMKRILIFSLAYYPIHVSGAEAAIQEITDRINDLEFHLITLRFDAALPREEKIGAVVVHRVGGSSYAGKILFPFTAALAAKRIHRAQPFDAMWAVMTYMLLPAMFAKALGVRVPHILTLQDGDPYEKVFGRLRILPFLPIIDWGFRTATVIQVISNYLAQWPARRGSKAPVVLIYNGGNPRDLKEVTSPEEIAQTQRSLGKKAGDIFLINTSRLVHQKGNDTTIRALPLLPPTVKLVLVGTGNDEPLLKALAKELDVAQRVVFVGQVDRAQVTRYRRASDIFVAPSRSEGLGNAFISALASRVPLITTGVGGIADYAFDGTTAWLVPVDDPRAIAQKVQEILADPEKSKEISARARAMVEEKYDWDKIARQMRTDVFDTVI